MDLIFCEVFFSAWLSPTKSFESFAWPWHVVAGNLNMKIVFEVTTVLWSRKCHSSHTDLRLGLNIQEVVMLWRTRTHSKNVRFNSAYILWFQTAAKNSEHSKAGDESGKHANSYAAYYTSFMDIGVFDFSEALENNSSGKIRKSNIWNFYSQ